MVVYQKNHQKDYVENYVNFVCQFDSWSYDGLIYKYVNFFANLQGGNNAGHTVVVGEKRYAFHIVPRYGSMQCTDI